jgi:hypothetical protein
MGENGLYGLIAVPADIESFRREFIRLHGLPYGDVTNSAYLPRAVSTVPDNEKSFLEEQYLALIQLVEISRIGPLVPVETSPGVDKNKINSQNDAFQRNSRFNIPLTYATSDGRGFEIGISWALFKPTIALVRRGQGINVPTLRRSEIVPVYFNNFLKDYDRGCFISLLEEFQKYDFGSGRCSEHGVVLAGFERPAPGKTYSAEAKCMRCKASDYMEVVPSKM